MLFVINASLGEWVPWRLFARIVLFLVRYVIISMIVDGINWARITQLVIFIAGVPIDVLLLTYLIISPSIPLPVLIGVGVVVVGEFAIQAAALIILFQKTSSAWFKALKATD